MMPLYFSLPMIFSFSAAIFAISMMPLLYFFTAAFRYFSFAIDATHVSPCALPPYADADAFFMMLIYAS